MVHDPYTNSPRGGQASKCIALAISRASSEARSEASDPSMANMMVRAAPSAPSNRPLGQVNSQASIARGVFGNRDEGPVKAGPRGLWPLSSALDPEGQSNEPPTYVSRTLECRIHMGEDAMYRRAT